MVWDKSKKTRNSMCIVSHHKHAFKFLELPQTTSATSVLFYLFSTPTGNTARLQHLQTETAISLAQNFMILIWLSLSKFPGRFLLPPFCSSS